MSNPKNSHVWQLLVLSWLGKYPAVGEENEDAVCLEDTGVIVIDIIPHA
jgi:hypothetical protein